MDSPEFEAVKKRYREIRDSNTEIWQERRAKAVKNRASKGKLVSVFPCELERFQLAGGKEIPEPVRAQGHCINYFDDRGRLILREEFDETFQEFRPDRAYFYEACHIERIIFSGPRIAQAARLFSAGRIPQISYCEAGGGCHKETYEYHDGQLARISNTGFVYGKSELREPREYCDYISYKDGQLQWIFRQWNKLGGTAIYSRMRLSHSLLEQKITTELIGALTALCKQHQNELFSCSALELDLSGCLPVMFISVHTEGSPDDYCMGSGFHVDTKNWTYSRIHPIEPCPHPLTDSQHEKLCMTTAEILRDLYSAGHFNQFTLTPAFRLMLLSYGNDLKRIYPKIAKLFALPVFQTQESLKAMDGKQLGKGLPLDALRTLFSMRAYVNAKSFASIFVKVKKCLDEAVDDATTLYSGFTEDDWWKITPLLENALNKLDKELQSARKLAPEKRRISLKTLMEHKKACRELIQALDIYPLANTVI